MHLWNMQLLSKELAEDRVTERAGLHYYLASSIIIIAVMYYSLWWGAARDWLFFSELISLTLITVVGSMKAYQLNGGDLGRSFVFRAVCLSVSAAIRANLIGLLLGQVLYSLGSKIFVGTVFADPDRAYILVYYVIFIGLNLYFWWLMIRGFSCISKHSISSDPGMDRQSLKQI